MHFPIPSLTLHSIGGFTLPIPGGLTLRKFGGAKLLITLEFEIVHCDFGNSNWQDDYNKWIISKKENCWESSTAESGIVGLDFSCVKMDKQHSSDKTLLNQWALLHQGVHCEINNKNVALKLLSNSNGNRI